MEATTKRVNGLRKEGKKAPVARRRQDGLRERERRAGTGETGEERRGKRLTGVKPVVETKSQKRAGRAHQVPTPVSERRGRYRATTWIREATRKRAKKNGISMGDARRMELRR